jgi:hypothetical protein
MSMQDKQFKTQLNSLDIPPHSGDLKARILAEAAPQKHNNIAVFAFFTQPRTLAAVALIAAVLIGGVVTKQQTEVDFTLADTLLFDEPLDIDVSIDDEWEDFLWL